MKANQFAMEEQAQVGIGTMIVFIATVLVAAVAAGVLVSVGGDLQSQSKATGSQASADVANALGIVRAYGVDISGADTTDTTTIDGNDAAGVEAMDELHLYVRLAAGSGSVNFEAVEVLLDTGDGVTTYAFTDSPEQDQAGAPTLTAGDYFTAEPQGAATGNSIDGNEMYLIRILGTFDPDPDANPVTNDQSWGDRLDIGADEDLTVTIVLPNGSPTFIELSTPRVLDEPYEKLY